MAPKLLSIHQDEKTPFNTLPSINNHDSPSFLLPSGFWKGGRSLLEVRSSIDKGQKENP